MADALTSVSEVELLGKDNGPVAWMQYAAVRGILGGISRMPRGLQTLYVSALARLARSLDKRHSNAARAYLRQALGCAAEAPDIEARILTAWRHFLQLSIDAAAFDRKVGRDLLAHVEVERCEGLDELIASERGGLLVSPHLGDWEAGSAFLPDLGFDPLLGIAKPPKNRPLSRYLQRMRMKRRLVVLPRRGGIDLAAEGLKSGSWLLVLLDQRPRKGAVVAPFFGRPVLTERSAGVLARRLRLPIVYFHCLKTEEPFQYRMRFTRVVTSEEVRAMSIEELATLSNEEAERAILGCPEQYFWLHDRFRQDP